MSSLIPTGYRVLIKPDPLEEESDGGILIVYTNERQAQAATQTGTIISIGDFAWDMHKGGDPWCGVGDHVVYARYAGKLITDVETGEEFLVVNDEDILAIKRKAEDE